MTLFIENKYNKWYFNIIDNAKLRNLPKKSPKTEIHHVIPKSMGGNNSDQNLVILTYKEHFICHRLLVRCTESYSKRNMAYALCIMLGKQYKNNKRNSSRIYEKVRIEIMEAISDIPMPRETRRKISKSHTGKKKTKLHVENIRKGRIKYIKEHGIPEVTKETRKKLSEMRTGKKNTEETKKKMSESGKKAWKTRIKHKRPTRLTFKGRKHTAEAKEKIRQNNILRHARRKNEKELLLSITFT